MNAFPYLELRLVQATGLAKKAWKNAREKMAPGVDWLLTPAGIAYSAVGFRKAVETLGLSGLDLGELQKNALETPALPVAVDARKKGVGRVERFFMNRTLIGVRMPDGTLAQTRVGRFRDRFRRGKAIPVRPVAGGPFWELDGVMPRRRG